MLRELGIENVAVIEKAQVGFGRGLNILTGETGAGKSILIDSINAILGNRTSKEIVRSGASKSLIWAVFEDVSESIAKEIAEQGYEAEEELILQREITADGRSSCRINGRPATAAAVRAVCSRLINIHGQHDNQDLLNPERHIYILDAFAETKELLEEYTKLYSSLGTIRKQMDELSMDEALKERRIDLLRYQIEEIEKANPRLGEDDELAERRNIIRNAEKILRSLRSAYEALSGDSDSEGALSMIYSASREMGQISDISEELSALSGRLDDGYYALSDVGAELRSQLESFDFDAGDAEAVEERLDVYYKLKRKYGTTIEEILEFLEKSRSELGNIEMSDELLAKYQAQYERTLKKAQEQAQALSEKRKAAFPVFENRIRDELSYLNMPNVTFSVECRKTELSKLGFDDIEFYLSTNAGEPPRPMSRIASGGELSRIMLAIKNALADKDSIDTLIFDEIDTGVSGSSAGKIGRKLKESAKSRQTICVTHSAQIAAYADSHLKIEKNVRGERTFTDVRTLDHGERVRELARIVSGDNVTDLSLSNAEEMLALSV